MTANLDSKKALIEEIIGLSRKITKEMKDWPMMAAIPVRTLRQMGRLEKMFLKEVSKYVRVPLRSMRKQRRRMANGEV